MYPAEIGYTDKKPHDEKPNDGLEFFVGKGLPDRVSHIK